MDEAMGSFNGYFRSPQGNKDQFTLRQAEDQADKDFVLRVRSFVKLLAENGWTEWGAEHQRVAAENESSSPREFDKAKLQEGGEDGEGQSLYTAMAKHSKLRRSNWLRAATTRAG